MDRINLTENEKRDINKYLDSGKPLPEKFRFLLFADKKEVELVWNGKTSEVTNVVLPFQTIEVVDEPRAENTSDTKKQVQQMLFDFDDRGRQIAGWTNKLIWGDNKLILSSLKSQVMREEIEKEGGIKLIYIDPPFDVGADFSMKVEIGDPAEGEQVEVLTKKPNVLEELAYRDTWGKGADSFIAMIYERLSLMKDLLADDGSIYVHCDWRVSGYMRLVLDEVFGKDNFVNEIIWKKLATPKAQTIGFGNIHDSIFYYKKGEQGIFNEVKVKHGKDYLDAMYRHTEADGGRYRLSDFTQKGQGEAREFGNKILEPPSGKHWIWSQEKIDEGMKKGLIVFSKNGIPSVKRYLDDVGGHMLSDLWTDIKPMSSQAKERTDYPTQKPLSLLERIIKASSNKGDLVADFFCGSGTTLAVAEKLGRKWIGSDLGKFAIHTTRKRMIGVQREMKSSGTDFRAFEILNLGKYERQHYIGVNQPAPRQVFYIYVIKCENDSLYIGQTKNISKRWDEHKQGKASWTSKYKPTEIIHYEEFQTRDEAVEREKDLKTGFGWKWLKQEYLKNNLKKWNEYETRQAGPDLREEQRQKQLAEKEKNFVKLIVKAYKAEAINNFKTFVAQKAGRLVAIGPINLPASRLFVEEVIKECIEKQITKVDILSFEYEMGLFPKIQEEAKAKGIDLALKHIPREVFDKRAIEKNQIQFHNVSYIEVKPHIKPADKRTPGTVAIELTDFSVYYNQDIVDNVTASLKKGANKILLERGNIIKMSKDKAGIVKREVLTRKWTDWIDYWAVDFDFESKKELVRVKGDNGEIEERWTGDYIFENEWQSFRTKKDHSIELKSVSHEFLPAEDSALAGEKGRRKIAIKVVDIFGNDTMKVIEVNI